MQPVFSLGLGVPGLLPVPLVAAGLCDRAGASGTGASPGRRSRGPHTASPRTPPPRTPPRRGQQTGPAGPASAPGPLGDLPALDLPGHGVQVVESDLLPVDIQLAYDGHRDLLALPGAPKRPHANLVTQPIVTRLSWGGPYWRTATAPDQTLTPTRRCMSSNGRLALYLHGHWWCVANDRSGGVLARRYAYR